MFKQRTCLLLLIAIFAASGLAANPVPPKAIETFLPQFPFEALKEGASGSAVVKFVIDVDGKAADITVVNATRKDFGDSAVACIAKWRFQPAQKDGKKIRSRAQQAFNFPHPGKEEANQPSQPTPPKRRG